MTLKDRRFLEQERRRLTRYQHQHRGLSFIKLWLPPTSDKDANIIGRDGHVYKGKIPRVPLDQLPPEVDPETVDEGELYEEIRDMKYLDIPIQEPLGPTRRIGGEYTKAKRLTLAPVEFQYRKAIEETPIIGADVKMYHGPIFKSQLISEMDLDHRESMKLNRSDKDFVEPTLVTLHVDGRAINPFQEIMVIGADGKLHSGSTSKSEPISDLDHKAPVHSDKSHIEPKTDEDTEDMKEADVEDKSEVETEDKAETDGKSEVADTEKSVSEELSEEPEEEALIIDTFSVL
ncbi:uncharacterized protein [Parasteatoda tepidariorum]|uniref:uncharacterized protein n=1 Tax=Parasteatoda tepidariorum TaxID=114398 RepID=UPI001C71A1AC|nr:uncharacterized protein LOC107438665 [Parasteatoda tepidariorum]